MFSH
jgi:hypothetical protein